MSARAADSIHLEAEDGALHGLEIASSRRGFSGQGYVTGFDHVGDRVEFSFQARAGIYELRIRYASPFGHKVFQLTVNEEKRDGTFASYGNNFNTHRAGKFRLKRGLNLIVIDKGWGFFDIDSLDLDPAQVEPPESPPLELVDPDADACARRLMEYLVSIYGRRTLAGQQDMSEIDYVRHAIGEEPAVGSFDFMDYSPSRVERGVDPKKLTDKIVAWGRDGRGIASISWHWNAPLHLIDELGGKEWWRGFYTSATDFDVEAALADTSSKEFMLLLRDMDAIAVHLRRLSNEGIPVLWRPLHEAQGGWFWWGAKGPKTFVALWKLMFTRYVKQHGLHNLIWVYSPPGTGIKAVDWYPGDSFVDVVAADVYADPSSSMINEWEALQSLYEGRKLIALSECGNVVDPDKIRAYETRWLWFSVWSGKFIRQTPKAVLKAAYADRDIITRSDLPDLRPRRRGGR